MTAGLAGADLANIINEAALLFLAGRTKKIKLDPSDFKEAVERQIAGLEKNQEEFLQREKNCCLSWIWTCFNCRNYKRC